MLIPRKLLWCSTVTLDSRENQPRVGRDFGIQA
jgi:hypothetical protein